MVRVINKTNETRIFQIQADAAEQNFSVEGLQDGITVPPMGEEVRPVIISLLREDYQGQFPLTLTLVGPDAAPMLTREAEFIGPDPKRLKPNQ